MKFSAEKKEVFRELQLLQGIVEKRNTMPILANILINASEKGVEMIGTDLEVGMKTHFSADTKDPGAITISGKKIFEIVRSLPEGKPILFSQQGEKMMEINSGASHFKVVCMHKEDYPQVPEPRFKKNIVFPLGAFQEMIDQVFCAITQEQRYYLNGALMILSGDEIKMVSTDGHRLAYSKKNFSEMNVEGEIRGIVSKKTLGELRKLEDTSVQFDLDENNLFFQVGERTLISRIIEGKFPNYDAVIPKDNQSLAVFNKEEITDAIRRVSLLSTERSKGIKFNLKKNAVELFSSNPELGEASDQVDADYDGAELEIGFNAAYLIDFLATARTEKVQFLMKDENSAVLIFPEDEESGDEYKYVLMPMKF
ncbi:MAG: DNA polymerase III subunit beta [Candidatus Aminicenantes bacterium]